jgi:cell division septal protein FtsQ
VRPKQVRRTAAHAATAGRRTLLLAGLALALATLGYNLSREASNPGFRAVIVSVRGGQHTAAADIIAAAALPANQNAWLIDRTAVRRRIEALPWVDRAWVSVSWPNCVSISVSERTAVAALETGETGVGQPGYAVIDATQRVVEIAHRESTFANLPRLIVAGVPADVAAGQTLSDPDVARALSALRELRALGLTISAVAIAPSTGISATANRDVRVLFGDDEDLARKAALFQAIVAKLSTPKLVAYVDVRSIHAPTVLYR